MQIVTHLMDREVPHPYTKQGASKTCTAPCTRPSTALFYIPCEG